MKLEVLTLATLLASASVAGACTADGILFFDANLRATLIVAPDDLPLSDSRGITVTGAYTGTETRENGAPAPVGFFLRDGEIINRNGGPMDGVFLIDEDGARITRRDVLGIDSAEGRVEMSQRAQAESISLLQSHLLISDGELDLREVEDAPRFTRRILIQTEDGIGIWQSAQPLTLYAAAVAVETACAPTMALNLDMGSYDYCVSDGRYCGIRRDTDRLSNLLRLERGQSPQPAGNAED